MLVQAVPHANRLRQMASMGKGLAAGVRYPRKALLSVTHARLAV